MWRAWATDVGSYREAFGDVFDMPGDLLCVLTNQQVNAQGLAVMGGGQAARARRLFPGVARALGDRLRADADLGFAPLGAWRRQDFGVWQQLAAFPTKQHWAEGAHLELIARSAVQLMHFLDTADFTDVLLPRPGCGLGGLRWEQVEPVLTLLLDERIIIVTYEAL